MGQKKIRSQSEDIEKLVKGNPVIMDSKYRLDQRNSKSMAKESRNILTIS